MKINSKMAQFLGLDTYEKNILNSMNEKRFLISEISGATEIPRTSLYYILPRLLSRGFLEKRKIGTKTYWRKVSHKEYVANYQKFILKQDNDLVFNDKIKIVYGIPALTQTLLSVTDTEPKQRWYGIQPKLSVENLIRKVDLTTMNQFNETVKSKKLIVEGIVHEDYIDKIPLEREGLKSLFKSLGGRTIDYAKLPRDYLAKNKSEIYLWQNKVAIMNWEKEFAIIIENEDVFDLLKAMFTSTKYMLQKYDQNEKIAKKLVDLEGQ